MYYMLKCLPCPLFFTQNKGVGDGDPSPSPRSATELLAVTPR